MIVREQYTGENGVKLTRTYSNEDKYIRKVGTNEIYSEAIDIEGKNYEYEEIDEYVEQLSEDNYGNN